MSIYREYPFIENLISLIAYSGLPRLESEKIVLEIECTKFLLELFRKNSEHNSEHVIVICMGGLFGDSQSTYIRSIVYELTKKYDVFVINYRNLNLPTEEETVIRPQKFTLHQDNELIKVSMKRIKNNRYKKYIAIGYSMGANILSHYIAENPKEFDGFLSISNYYDVMNQMAMIQKNPYFKLYVEIYYYYIFQKNKIILDKKISFEQLIEKYFLVDGITWEDYFLRSSSCVLNKINIPSIMLNSYNDLLTEKDFLEGIKEKTINSNISFRFFETGSHIAYSKELLSSYVDELINSSGKSL